VSRNNFPDNSLSIGTGSFFLSLNPREEEFRKMKDSGIYSTMKQAKMEWDRFAKIPRNRDEKHSVIFLINGFAKSGVFQNCNF
jgi:hypothetical protein